MRSNKKRSRAALSKSTVSILSTEDEAIARSSTTMAFQFRTTTIAPTAAGATGAVPAALFWSIRLPRPMRSPPPHLLLHLR